MSSLAPIVVYGQDPRLLETRRLVLQTLGGKVCAAGNLERTEQLVHDLKPGVLVLCYTLTYEARELILFFAQTHYPKMKVLTLHADGRLADTSDSFSIFTGPAALKTKVAEMLYQ